VEKINTDQELSVLFPETSRKSSVEYASRPQSVKLASAKMTQKSACPVYANVIQLKTLDANLYLNFKFSLTDVASDFEHEDESQNTVMISSETAKKLLMTLADLFQCEIKPK